MSAEPPEVHGRCEPAFESLRRALADVIETGAEVGAALAVQVDKQPVVDLWAGHQDSARTRPWDEQTIVDLKSVGEGSQRRLRAPPRGRWRPRSRFARLAVLA